MTSQVQEGTILLGKYRVEKELGQGAMGYVVAARHEHLGELFAVKLMLPEALERPEAAARFLREARACARIKSEHVVRVTDSGEHEPGMPIMVMEYLVGEDLQAILDKQKVFPLPEAVNYVLQACDAIAEAHEIGILHRDLKPSNLFLTRRPNGKPCVKVLDFGISKDLNQGGDKPSKLTATGSVLGTPCYMSPEQMQARTTDNRSDIWSLGVILYEFATGKLPFPGETYASIAGKVIYEEPVPPSRVRPGLPAEFDAVVLRCLEKVPDKRFPSVRELIAALEPLALLAPQSVLTAVAPGAASSLDDANKETILDKDTATAKLPVTKGAEKSALPARSGDSKSEFDQTGHGATNFYAKRAIDIQAGKSSRSKKRSGNTALIFSALFALLAIGLLGSLWIYRDQVRSSIRGFNESGTSASVQPGEEMQSPENLASSAPSSSIAAPPVTAKTNKSVPNQTAPKPRASTSTVSSGAAAPSTANTPAPAPSASTKAP